MLFQSLIRQHITDQEIEHVIFHNGVVFLKETFKTLLFLAILFLLHSLLQQRIHRPMLKWVFGILGSGFLIKYSINALDIYLDCILLSKEGVTFFARDGFLKYKTDMFSWEKVETITHTQSTLRDKICMKGDISIHLEHDIHYTFKNVSSPKLHVEKILQLKEHNQPKGEQKKEESNPELSSILSEALSEVVKEYLERKKTLE